MSDTQAMIKLENIKKSYGKVEILKGVNMQINKGDIYGLIGKNGAGKTTIFKMTAPYPSRAARTKRNLWKTGARSGSL